MALAGLCVITLALWTLLAYVSLPLPFQDPLFAWLKRQWLVEGIAACAFLGLAGVWWSRRITGLARPAWWTPWGVWLAWAGLSVLISIDRGLTLRSWLAFAAYGTLALATFELASASVRGPRVWAQFLAGLGIVAALEGWFQYAGTFAQTIPLMERLQATGGLDLQGWGGGVMRDFLERKRIFSVFGWPNLYAGFLLLVTPIVAALSADAAGPLSRLAWGVAAGVLAVSLLLTLSMGGWCAAVMTGCLLWLFSRRPPLVRVLVLGTVVCGALLGGGLIIAKRARPFIQYSLSSRVVYVQGALRVIAQRPLVGTGLGTFGVAYHAVKPREGFEGQHTALHAHNTLLEISAELGLIGLGLFLWMLWPMARLVYHAVGPDNSSPSWLARGLGVGILAFFLHGLLEQAFVEAVTAPFWWFALGLLTAIMAPGRPTSGEVAGPRGRAAWLPGLVAGAGLFVLVRLTAADAWAAQAGFLGLAGRHEASLQALTKAQQWDPLTGRYPVEHGERLLRRAQPGPRAREALPPAKAQFERAVAISPWMGHAWLRLGEISWQLGETERAVAASREAVRRDPNSRRALKQWAHLRYALGDLPGTLEASRRLQQLEPGEVEGWFLEALVKGRTGPVSEALRAYGLLVEGFSDHYPAWFNLAELLRRQGQMDAAAAAYRRFLALAPAGDTRARAVAEQFAGASE